MTMLAYPGLVTFTCGSGVIRTWDWSIVTRRGRHKPCLNTQNLRSLITWGLGSAALCMQSKGFEARRLLAGCQLHVRWDESHSDHDA